MGMQMEGGGDGSQTGSGNYYGQPGAMGSNPADASIQGLLSGNPANPGQDQAFQNLQNMSSQYQNQIHQYTNDQNANFGFKPTPIPGQPGMPGQPMPPGGQMAPPGSANSQQELAIAGQV